MIGIYNMVLWTGRFSASWHKPHFSNVMDKLPQRNGGFPTTGFCGKSFALRWKNQNESDKLMPGQRWPITFGKCGGRSLAVRLPPHDFN
jgi:hypothetical protein